MLPRLRLNLGFATISNPTCSTTAFTTALLKNPAFTGINNFVSNNRPTNYNEGWQPRLGAAWDITGKGSVVVRAGFGKYVTRMREYWDTSAETQTFGAAVVITNPTQLQNYPSITAVLNGLSLSQYVPTSADRRFSFRTTSSCPIHGTPRRGLAGRSTGGPR